MYKTVNICLYTPKGLLGIKRKIIIFLSLLLAIPLFAQKYTQTGGNLNFPYGYFGDMDLMDAITNANGNRGKINTLKSEITKHLQYCQEYTQQKNKPMNINSLLEFPRAEDGSRVIANENLLTAAGFSKLTAIVDFLIEKGAILDLEGVQSPLIPAAQIGDLNMVKHLVERYHANVNAQIPNSKTNVLASAIEFGQKNVFDYLLNNPNIDINLKDASNNSPLKIAFNVFEEEIKIQHGFQELIDERAYFVRTLLNHCVNIDASLLNNQLFIENFAADIKDCNATDNTNIFATNNEEENKEGPKEENNAYINAGNIPHALIEYCDKDDDFNYLLCLISRKPIKTSLDPMVQPVDGIDVWTYAIDKVKKHPEYLDMVSDHKTLLTAAGSAGSVGFIIEFTKRGAIIDQNDAISPLISASQTGRESTIDYLLRHGADINAQAPETLYTALMTAIIFERVDTLETLFRSSDKYNLNLDVNLVSSENKTALKYAYEKGCIIRSEKSKENYDICALLIDRNAEIDDDLLNAPAFDKYIARRRTNEEIQDEVNKRISHYYYYRVNP